MKESFSVFLNSQINLFII